MGRPLKSHRYRSKKGFYSKDRHKRHFNQNKFLIKVLYLIIFIIAILIVYNNIGFFNKYKIFFIKTNILPQPWGFIAFWGAIIVIGLILLTKFVFHGKMPKWFVWILVIVGIIVLFQYKIPYKTVNVEGVGAFCDEDNIFRLKSNIFGVGEMSLGMQCMEYGSSQCRPMCIEKKPICQCEANLIDIVFHQEGDWFFR